MHKRRKYEEGTWFLVPISDDKFLPGVVTRTSVTNRGVLLGYFFADLFTEKPRLETLCNLKASGARADVPPR